MTDEQPVKKYPTRGFGSMSSERRREISSMGGKAQGKHSNPSNFANNHERAVRAGQKGGRISRKPKKTIHDIFA